mmetsp:Transcript_5046/g.32101  ORF Transcript_5046/g.32101 Transcript_5046/m.32101 type:complete len:129 (-) Transcript_5046:4798-5184(-)
MVATNPSAKEFCVTDQSNAYFDNLCELASEAEFTIGVDVKGAVNLNLGLLGPGTSEEICNLASPFVACLAADSTPGTGLAGCPLVGPGGLISEVKSNPAYPGPNNEGHQPPHEEQPCYITSQGEGLGS